MHENNIVSRTLKTTDFFIFFLKNDIFLFTHINNAPNKPPTIQVQLAHGHTEYMILNLFKFQQI